MYEKNNPYESIGNNWYARKLSENIYEYIYQGTIGDGAFYVFKSFDVYYTGTEE